MRHLSLVACSRPQPCITALRCSPAVALYTPPEHPRSPTQHLFVVGRRVSRAAKSVANAVVTLVLALLLVLPLPSPSLAMTVDMTAPPAVTTDVGLPGGAMRRRYGMPTLPVTMPRKKTSFVTSAVDAVGPSVVRIDTERLIERVPLENYLFPGLEPEGPPRKESGQGSGVILSEEGIIMTNAHVVNKANRVTVTLTDGRTFQGTVTGSDEFLDLAVVKIEKPKDKPLPTAPLGRSEDLQVGDWVVAIGNAVGLDSTVTLGIVSSLSRSAAEVGIPGKKVNFIQTDAAINPGNSGGPLLNEFGEVIGVNTAIRANAAGIGFAIPIDTAERAVRILAEGKRIPHAYLGLSMSSLTEETARQNNAEPNSNVELPVTAGALVLNVGENSPAATAGFRRFDVVTEINGQAVRSAADAQTIVDASKVGQELIVRVLRGSNAKAISITVITSDLSDRPNYKP